MILPTALALTQQTDPPQFIPDAAPNKPSKGGAGKPPSRPPSPSDRDETAATTLRLP